MPLGARDDRPIRIAGPAAAPASASFTEPQGDPTPPEIGHTVSFIGSDFTIKGCPPDRPGLPVVHELRRRGSLVRRGPWPILLEVARKAEGGTLGERIYQAPRSMPESGRLDQAAIAAPQFPAVHRRQSR